MEELFSLKLQLLSGIFLEVLNMGGKRRETKIVDGVHYQKCTKCGEWVEATHKFFNYANTSKAKLHTLCIKCSRIKNKEYTQRTKDKRHKRYQNNREKILAQAKIYNIENRVNRQKYAKEYYQKNRATFLENSKEYYLKNKERYNIVSKAYYTNNREKIRIKAKKYYDANRDAITEKGLLYYADNKEKQKEYREIHKNELTKKRRLRYKENKGHIRNRVNKLLLSQAKFITYAHQLTIEEDPKEGEDGKLLCKCAYCGQYFYPITKDVVYRIKALNGKQRGEMRLYCSTGCKEACPIFNQIKYPKGHKPASSREVDPLIRQMCLKRDDYICQKCEKTIDEIELHAHHLEGTVQQPMLANDVDNTITLCKPCHKWVHKQKGCTKFDLRCK